MTTWADEYVTMLEDCEKRSEKLTDWECGFVDSLQRQIADGRRPSAKQVETLDNIWERAAARTVASKKPAHRQFCHRVCL